ncbi:hypothetical protein EV421DRAFT_1740179 [Armillaria borealis]|uniref:Uncharacterized protein n=1 Tax=Armillaria borealis TaxID=47425 RepID=A0AA39J4Y9_9AGAR|nr:hypothetical protein EV421DRAFT_1740179 [Armillaria borealis]
MYEPAFHGPTTQVNLEHEIVIKIDVWRISGRVLSSLNRCDAEATSNSSNTVSALFKKGDQSKYGRWRKRWWYLCAISVWNFAIWKEHGTDIVHQQPQTRPDEHEHEHEYENPHTIVIPPSQRLGDQIGPVTGLAGYAIGLSIGVDDSGDGPFVPSTRAPNTLLVLKSPLRLPAVGAQGSDNVHTPPDLWFAIRILDPRYVYYASSHPRRKMEKRSMAMTRRATETRVTPAMRGRLSVDDGLVETVGVEDDDDAVDGMMDWCSVSRRNMELKDDARIASPLTTLTTKPNTPSNNDRDKTQCRS